MTPAGPAPDELAALSALVGAPVVAAERGRWGFENRTDIVTLVDGTRLVVQRITRRFAAPQRIALARALPPLLAAAGIRAPRLLAADPDHDPPYAIRELLPGQPANVLLASDGQARLLARAMGALLPRLAGIPPAGAPLPDTWADPVRLASVTRQRLAACADLLDGPAVAAIEAAVERLPTLFAARPAALAHGDYCPVNALIEARDLRQEARESAQDNAVPADTLPPSPSLQPLAPSLIDFDEARLADPLYDAAWWGWVVRYHHPERWHAAWPELLAAAGIPWDAGTGARVGVLQLLRLLEALDEARRHEPTAAAGWAARLRETAAWSR